MAGVFGAQNDGAAVVEDAEGVLAGRAAGAGCVVEVGDEAGVGVRWPGPADLFGEFAFGVVATLAG